MTLDRSYYSMHLIHFKENSMVAPDHALPVQGRGLSNAEWLGWRRLGHLLGLPLTTTVCGWLAFGGCLNWCFNKCCCDARVCGLVGAMCASTSILTFRPLLPHLQLASPFQPPPPCRASPLPLPVHLCCLILPQSTQACTPAPAPRDPTPSGPSSQNPVPNLPPGSNQFPPYVCLLVPNGGSLCLSFSHLLFGPVQPPLPPRAGLPWMQAPRETGLPFEATKDHPNGHIGPPMPLFPFAFAQCVFLSYPSSHRHTSPPPPPQCPEP